MKRYKANFMTSSVDKDGYKQYKNLGSVEFIYFTNSKVSLMSKAFMLALGEQKDANCIKFTELN